MHVLKYIFIMGCYCNESWEFYPQLWLWRSKSVVSFLPENEAFFSQLFQQYYCVIPNSHSYDTGVGAIEFIICHSEVSIAFAEEKKIPEVLLSKPSVLQQFNCQEAFESCVQSFVNSQSHPNICFETFQLFKTFPNATKYLKSKFC